MYRQKILKCLFVISVLFMISIPVSAQTNGDIIELNYKTIMLLNFEYPPNSITKVSDLLLNESYYVEVQTNATSSIAFRTRTGVYDFTYFAIFLQTPMTYRINLLTVLNASSYNLIFRTYNETCSGYIRVYGIDVFDEVVGDDGADTVKTVTIVVESMVPYIFSGILSVITIFVLVKVIVLQRKNGNV